MRASIQIAQSISVSRFRSNWGYLPTLRAFYSYKLLTGLPARSNIEERLYRYSQEELIVFASKLALVAERDDGVFKLGFQMRLAHDLLPTDVSSVYEIANYINSVRQKLQNKPEYITPFFLPLHAVNFLRSVVNLEQSKFAGRKARWSEQDVFSILLQMTSKSFDSEEQRDNVVLVGELIRIYMFSEKEDISRLISRFYRMLFDSPATLNTQVSRVHAQFQNATGIPLTEFFSVGVAILGSFIPASILGDKKIDLNHVCVFNWQSYFREHQRIASMETSFSSFLAGTINELREDYQRLTAEASSLGVQRSIHYDFYTFARKPLIKLKDGTYVCSYYPFLVEKFTSSIYWIILDSLDKSSQGVFKNDWGEIVQAYVEEVFKQDIIPYLNIQDRFVLYDIPYGSTNARASDIMLFDKKNKELFLFEVTYSSFRTEVAFRDDNIEAFSDGLKKIASKCKQIDTVISAIKSDTLKLPGISSKSIRTFRPYVVTLNAAPRWIFLWHGFDEKYQGLSELLKQDNCLQCKDIAPPKLLSVAEIEELGSLQRIGVDIFSILRDWSKTNRWADEALHSFLVDRYGSKGDYPSVYKNIQAALALVANLST